MDEMTLPKTITENGMEYILDEETQTYLPNLSVPEGEPIGKYGMLRKKYLKENRSPFYQAMLIKGTLDEHLREIDQTAKNRLDRMLPDMMKSAGVTEQLKAADQMKWVGLMNNIKHSAEEIILNELIYS